MSGFRPKNLALWYTKKRSLLSRKSGFQDLELLGPGNPEQTALSMTGPINVIGECLYI